MSRPNSRLTRLRRKLARQIGPGPAPGEAWCVDCALNFGRTLVLSADGHQAHLRLHGGEYKLMQVAWPVRIVGEDL